MLGLPTRTPPSPPRARARAVPHPRPAAALARSPDAYKKTTIIADLTAADFVKAAAQPGHCHAPMDISYVTTSERCPWDPAVVMPWRDAAEAFAHSRSLRVGRLPETKQWKLCKKTSGSWGDAPGSGTTVIHACAKTVDGNDVIGHFDVKGMEDVNQEVSAMYVALYGQDTEQRFASAGASLLRHNSDKHHQ